MSKKLWVQQWEESERGWGVRPDGYTVHLNKADIDLFLKAMRDREASAGFPVGKSSPDEYSRPCGEPYLHEFTDDSEAVLALNVAVDDGKYGVWGPGKKPLTLAIAAEHRDDPVRLQRLADAAGEETPYYVAAARPPGLKPGQPRNFLPQDDSDRFVAMPVNGARVCLPVHHRAILGERVDNLVDCLMVLAYPGRIRLLPWAGNGDRVVTKRKELIATGPAYSKDTLTALLWIENRYRRAQVFSDGSVGLELFARAHLGEMEPKVLFAVLVEDGVEIWSNDYRKKKFDYAEGDVDGLEELP